MMRIHAAGATDTGQVRQSNEDSFWSGESVYAVADGMGGHLAGEVASAAALEPVAALDGRVFADGDEAGSALTEAVRTANAAVARMAAEEPAFRGMGTTLTVAMIEGRRLHIAHVGDSRAYLLRGGEFAQITDDHTLVQHLINEGQITKEEAATHPQRSIITRAIGVSLDVAVDHETLELERGDVLLLCSDGLTGVVSDDAIRDTLKRIPEPGEAAENLIDMANDQGGPDNITVLLLRYDETPSGPASRSGGDTGELEEQQPKAPVRVDSSGAGSDGDWADRLGRVGSLGRGRSGRYDPDDDDRGASRARVIGAVVVALVLFLGLVAAGGRWLLSRSYYVGLDQEQVVIYQGAPTDLGPIELSWVKERTDIDTDDVSDFFIDDLEGGLVAADLSDARRIIANIPRKTTDADEPTATEPDPAPTATTTAPAPTASPTAP
jgi:serine/threonine protein phosphatase PrpC